MTDIMYEIPSRKDVAKCIITKATVDEEVRPTLVLLDSNKKAAS